MAAIRYVGERTKITLTWQPRGGPAWVEGIYKASFNVGGVKMDSVILHVFDKTDTPGSRAVARTFDDLGISRAEAATPRGYDVAAKWAMAELLHGAQIAPHWRYGRAKAAAKALWQDVAAHGDKIRRRR